MLKWPTKHPGDDDDHGIDWEGAIGDAEILSSTWVVDDDDLELSDYRVNGSVTSVRLAGGTKGKVYTVTNTITIAGDPDPQTLNRSARIDVAQK